MPFSLFVVRYAETSWMWNSSSSFLSVQIWNRLLTQVVIQGEEGRICLDLKSFFWSRRWDFTASCLGCVLWAAIVIAAPFCEKRSIRQTFHLSVAVVCASCWNEQKFCVAFLPWAWRTWDGYMHFRLETFLPFTGLFKPLILLILYGLISPSFPLPCHPRKWWISE